jgi:molecular chaperone DnaK (HSP70)
MGGPIGAGKPTLGFSRLTQAACRAATYPQPVWALGVGTSVRDQVLEVRPNGAAATEWAIGIDFGTAFSKAAATRTSGSQGGVLREIRPLRLGEAGGGNRAFLIPSALYLDRSRIHFGARAIDRLLASGQDDRELARSFKTILGTNDFEEALKFYPRACVDPDRQFRLRDLIVLYLAYLLALVDVATAAMFTRGVSASSAARLRFSRPGWIPGRIAAAHEIMSALFSEAHNVRIALGETLTTSDGVPYATARAALDAARASGNDFETLDGGIYEASAVGVCHFCDRSAPNSLLIVDVGGGTTDVAGQMREPFSEDIRVVRTARRTIDVAGDDFDAALAELLLIRSRLRSKAELTALWRTIMPNIRELKEQLFTQGQIEVNYRGRKFRCTARDFESDAGFKAALRQIVVLYEDSLREMIATAKAQGQRRIGVVLAGGGSSLPALKKAITRPRWLGLGLRLEHLPATPRWAHELATAQEFDTLFAQLSAAFGAAISGSNQTHA